MNEGYAFSVRDHLTRKLNSKEGTMNACQKTAVLALVTMLVMVIPALGDNDSQASRVYFAKAIDKEISCCQNKQFLRSSKSDSLRMKGHREASKAIFLKAHKNILIDEMVAAGLEPKPYKVDLFLNQEFCRSCYAHWAVKQ